MKCSGHQLPVTSNAVPSSLIFFTLMTEEIRSTEATFLTRATRRHIPEYGILHSQRRQNIKYYVALTGWALQRRSYVSPVR
jgi:hypothetical protein